MGDIQRAYDAEKDFVSVNKRFTKLNGFEYMRARRLFLENEKINALPIVDSENRLIGDYSRWDDELSDSVFEMFDDERNVNILKNDIIRTVKKVALVKPCGLFPQKKVFMDKYRKKLEKIGFDTEVVGREDLTKFFEGNNYIIFADEDELRATDTLYRYIYRNNIQCRLLTLENCFKYELLDNSCELSTVTEILHQIKLSGIITITLQIKSKDNDYWKEFNRDIDEKYSKTCYIKSGNKKDNCLEKYEEFWKDFYDDLYDCEWTNETVNEMAAQRQGCIRKNGIIYLKDVKSSRCNVINGERMTVGQPLEYERTIYFYGPCLITGWYVEDSKTLESYLQAIVNEKEYRVRCVNYGSFQDELSLLLKICSTEYKKGDIVVIYDKNKAFDSILNIDLADSLERENVPAKWVVDAPQHCNHKVNEIYAKEIFNFIEDMFDEKSEDTIADKVEIPKDKLVKAYIDRYFHDYNPVGSIGSIVMNCNPFTLGHRYLIEQALTMVDNLIIFVVEEDKSLFSFRERYEMVREGTKDLANIKIAPSGDFILSQNTFPEYFLKIEDKDIVNNVENDITLFAEGVAPQLNITYRFVGEEKADRVTDTYNEAMKRILPAHGIEIIEIPRKTMADGEAISATRVRERLETYPFGDLSDLLPESTQRLLVQSW